MSAPSFSSLERFTRRARRTAADDACDLCGATIGNAHRHIVDRRGRRLLCACAPCGCAFVDGTNGRFRAVPDRVRLAPIDSIAVGDLEALGVPIGLAFFFRPSHLGRYIGVFPSPAGPTEAELPDGSFEAFVKRHAPALELQDDVEALLVRCDREGTVTVLVVPIDVCYELTAVVRRGWRGIDGGDDGRRMLDAFFTRLSERAREGAPS